MVVLAVGFGLGQLADCSNYQRATDREAGQLKGQVEILTGERENLAEAKTKAEEQRDKALEAARALNRVEALFGKDWQLAARETLVLNGPPQRFGYGACRTGHCLALEFKLVMNGSGQATLLTVGSIDGSTPAQIPYANVEARVPAFLPPVPARIGCFYAYSTPHVKARILIEQATVGSILIGVAARQVPPPNDSGEADYAFVCPPEAGVAR